MKYEYPAIFYAEKNGGYSVIFPDVEGAITQGENKSDAMSKAEEALAEILIAYEDFQVGRGDKMTNKISAPTVPEKIFSDENGTFTALVKIDTDEYRKLFYTQPPEKSHEVWYSPHTKKYYTMLADDDAEVFPKVEEKLREVSGVK